MRTFPTFIFVCMILLGTLFVSPVEAQTQQAPNQWAIDMFDHTKHDFGTVARGATVEHIFTFENIYNEDIEIASISSNCACTSAAVSKRRMKTWEKCKIKAIVDTRRYMGQKDATLKVRFAPPFATEVLLHVKTFIRSDVVLQPGLIDFGKVKQGTGAKSTATLTYDGSPQWAVTAVNSTNPYVSAVLRESQRNGGFVTYDMEVKLNSGAPAGYIRDQLTIVTNDPNPRQARVPVPVQGIVAPSIAVHPNPLPMGTVNANDIISKRLVIQSQVPFRILAIDATDRRFRCQASPESKKVHLVNVQYDATGAKVSESIDTSITIKTDMEGEEAKIPVQVSLKIVVHAEPTPVLPGVTEPVAPEPSTPEPEVIEPGILEPGTSAPVPLPADPPHSIPAVPTEPTPGLPDATPATVEPEPLPSDPSTQPPILPPASPAPPSPALPTVPVEPSAEPAVEPPTAPPIAPPAMPSLTPPTPTAVPEPSILPVSPPAGTSSSSLPTSPSVPPVQQADRNNAGQSELIFRL